MSLFLFIINIKERTCSKCGRLILPKEIKLSKTGDSICSSCGIHEIKKEIERLKEGLSVLRKHSSYRRSVLMRDKVKRIKDSSI